jgi:hypothetical protein
MPLSFTMGSSISKAILDIILNVALPVLDDILSGLGDVAGIRRFFDKRALGDAQGDYMQIYHKSLNDVTNHFYTVFDYQLNGPGSLPPHAINSKIYGFKDFCLYNPNNQVASNITNYLSDAFVSKGFNEQDVDTTTNALVGDIRQMRTRTGSSTTAPISSKRPLVKPRRSTSACCIPIFQRRETARTS